MKLSDARNKLRSILWKKNNEQWLNNQIPRIDLTELDLEDLTTWIKMDSYEKALAKVLLEGYYIPDRTGTGCIFLDDITLKYDLAEYFPILTSKLVRWRSVVAELLWFLQGSNDIRDLWDMDCHIWDEWCSVDYKSLSDRLFYLGRQTNSPNPELLSHQLNKITDFNLGPIYGHQWRKWGATHQYVVSGFARDGKNTPIMKPDPFNKSGFDQIAHVIEQLKANPWSRRILVNSWNPEIVDECALPWCHYGFQLTVKPDENGVPKYLSMRVNQRSGDMFLGMPFNIASYSLLLTLIAHETNLTPKHLIYDIGHAHIYANHYGQVLEQLSRPSSLELPLPELVISDTPIRISDMTYDSIKKEKIEYSNFYVNDKNLANKLKTYDQMTNRTDLVHLKNYKPLPFISAEVSV